MNVKFYLLALACSASLLAQEVGSFSFEQSFDWLSKNTAFIKNPATIAGEQLNEMIKNALEVKRVFTESVSKTPVLVENIFKTKLNQECDTQQNLAYFERQIQLMQQRARELSGEAVRTFKDVNEQKAIESVVEEVINKVDVEAQQAQAASSSSADSITLQPQQTFLGRAWGWTKSLTKFGAAAGVGATVVKWARNPVTRP